MVNMRTSVITLLLILTKFDFNTKTFTITSDREFKQTKLNNKKQKALNIRICTNTNL